MERLVYDIETDEIVDGKVSKLHCIVIQNIETNEVKVYHDVKGMYPWDGSRTVGLKRLALAKVVAGHNIKGFDEAAIRSLFGSVYYNPVAGRVELDTLCMSNILFPNRFEHSLESWMVSLKMPEQKIQNDDWSTLTQTVLNRCISDVKGNTILLRHFQKVCSKHSKQGTNWMPALFLEQDVKSIHSEQVKHGVWYDVETAKSNLAWFDEKMKVTSDYIVNTAPKKIKVPNMSGPRLQHFRESPNEFFKGVTHHKKPVEFKRPFAIGGVLSVKAKEALGLTVKDLTRPPSPHTDVAGPFSIWKSNYTGATLAWFGDEVTKVRGPYSKIELVPLNPYSDEQVKEFLKTLGWKPDEWNTKKMPDGSFLKTSPKLSESSFGSLPAGVGKDIQTFRQMKHRRGLIQSPKDETKGALAKVRASDQRVSAEAFTCGTPTARYRHSGAVCNIPRPSSPFGELIRELYGVHPDNWQVGVDLSGIEARMLAHFCFKYPGGPEFAELVTVGDWHSANALLWGCVRDDAKTELYALVYNAGPTKLGNILGATPAVGRRNKVKFMEEYTPYAMLVKDLESELEANGGYIIGLDGRRFYVRNKKDVLNTALQGNAAIVFKLWMRKLKSLRDNFSYEFRHTRVEQIIAYHDETQNEVYHATKAAALWFGNQACNLALEVGKELNLNIPIEAEAIVGKNWKETH